MAELPRGGEGAANVGRARRVGYWLYASHLWTVFGLAASNILLGLSIVALPWTARRSPQQPSAWRRLRDPAVRRLLLALAAYALLLGVAIVASYEPRVSVGATSDLFNLSSLVVGLLMVRGERSVRRIVDGIVVVSALIAVAGLSQYLEGFGDLHHRIRGPLSHYMTFSGVLLLGDLLLLAQMTWGGGWRRPWRWLALLAINAALLGSLTRSAWVALVVGLALLAWLRNRRLLVLLPAAALAFAVLAPRPVVARALSIADLSQVSNYDRLCMARAGLEMIAERPLSGIGPDLVEERYPIYRHPTAPRLWVPHLHNSFLQLAAERGLPALAAYLALMGLAMAAAWRRYRAEGGAAGGRADLYLGALLALVAFNVAGLFENNWGDTEVQRLVLFVLLVPFVTPAADQPSNWRS